jgi:hypothetical protein
MKGTHFEIGSHSYLAKNNSSHNDSYKLPLKNNLNKNIHDGSTAWEQRHKFRMLGSSPLGNFQTVNRERYTWL